METILTPKFMHSIEKIATEVSAITGIDEVDAAALEELLKDAICSARNIAYDDGRVDGYAEGYDVGFEDGYAV